MAVRIAVIGGTGVYNPDVLAGVRMEKVATPYGEVVLAVGELDGKEVAFLSRHGAGHVVPPHRVNYRANIAALAQVGVRSILATAAVGSLNPSMQPGHFVLVNQFIDFTRSRQGTFFDGGPDGVVHTDMSEPYCPSLREVIYQAAQGLSLNVHSGGTYVCTEGPRFESPAEIRMFQHWGGDLVGMTGVPEVVLAREKGLCYATVAMVTNFAAGISPTVLSHQEVVDVMNENAQKIQMLMSRAITLLDEQRPCQCQGTLSQPGEGVK